MAGAGKLFVPAGLMPHYSSYSSVTHRAV